MALTTDAESKENQLPRSISAGKKLAHPKPGEEIVISGLSGRYPNSDDVYQFRDNLFNKVDLLSENGRRWKFDHPEIPQRSGTINHITKFDASFFGVHYKQAHVMDPMCRMLLEKAYEAIIDAGLNPQHLKGTRCGVFLGITFAESERIWFSEKIDVNGFAFTGCTRAMIANRISYWLGVTGPSCGLDTACSSTLIALQHAYQAIRDGHCDTALVGGSHLCLEPTGTIHFFRTGSLSSDGHCRSFDNAAKGYCRSEAISMIFLQKAKDARRVYATVVHVKTNCDGFTEQGFLYPNGNQQCALMREFYMECGINPTSVNYVEAHGTGTRVGDFEECNALDKIFCKEREEPLLIGSVKSNMGHPEPVSGLCAISKIIIAMETGYIPPNLHFENPREDVPGLVEGRMKVITEKHPWAGGLVGTTSLGFGGANCHALLRWNEKEKVNGGAPKDNIPRLVLVSGRSDEACTAILDDLESRPIDVEYIKLLHEIHSNEILGHKYRGFTVLTNTGRKIRDVQYFSGEKRNIWFVFSGMGSQWPGMGRSLLTIPIFASAIEKCHKVLTRHDVDLMRILTEEDPKVFDNAVNSFVGIAAVQIGLVDILHSIGIFPDNIIGHSIGELGCAYADGCLTTEQTILVAYYQGLAFTEIDFIRGYMADVSIGYQNIKKLLPPEVELACHNGSDSCTLSGSSHAMKKLVSELTAQGISTREIPYSNIPYHSKYIAKARPKLLQYLQKVIQHPRLRSSKWISSSFPKSQWNTPLAKSSSAEYHTNNLLRPVLFEEACAHIPSNAITIEIAPCGFLQAILKRSLKEDTANIVLTQYNNVDNTQILFKGIGKLYEVGVQMQLANLYPSVKYPVSRGTPMISPLVKWDHSVDWYVSPYLLEEKSNISQRKVKVSLMNEDMKFIAGHVVDGRILFPATGYLFLVWETIGLIRGVSYTQLSIVFENVKFNRATPIPKEGFVDLAVQVHKGSGNFEIVENGVAVVTGRAYVPENINKVTVKLPKITGNEGEDFLSLSNADIYKELKLRGYHYSGLFKNLQSADNFATHGRITWSNNYVAFMDNMIQLQFLNEDKRGLFLPTFIQRVVVDAEKHNQCVHNLDSEGDKTLPVYYNSEKKITSSGGIQIHHVRDSKIARRKPLGTPVIEQYKFVPYISPQSSPETSLLETIRICIHIAVENLQEIKSKIVEVGDITVNPESILVAPYVSAIFRDMIMVQAEISVLSPANNPKASELEDGITVKDKKLSGEENCSVVIGSNILNRTELLQQALGSLKPEGFLIVRESVNATLPLEGFHVIFDKIVDNERILLLRKIGKDKIFTGVPAVLKISERDSFSWLPILKEYIADPLVRNIILVVEKEKENGLLGLLSCLNCFRKESNGKILRCVFIMDDDAPPFDMSNQLYSQQISKELAVNILKDGQWGSYRHIHLSLEESVSVDQVYLNPSVTGDLSSFKCYEGPLNVNRQILTPENDITVYYSSINFRDVMIATGKIPADSDKMIRDENIIKNLEFSGRITSTGRRVMGILDDAPKASRISFNPLDDLVWDVPNEWTLEEAASVPMVYLTVFVALVVKGRIKRGESILIHSGTGGIGLAAIRMALYYDCEIFVTVGTSEKREYLKQNFPQIKDSQIGYSRDTSFEQMVATETRGKGVDLVLNSLTEDKLQASVRCLATDGRFLEIGKLDMINNNSLDMEAFKNGISFHSVMLDRMFYSGSLKMAFGTMFKDFLQKGVFKPLKTTVFDISEVEQAFRYMGAGKHIGKVILKFRDEEKDLVALPIPKLYDSLSRFYCNSAKSYIIIGGLGGLGLEMTDWLITRGARAVVLASRSGVRTGYQAMRLRLWRDYGVKIVISTQDITTEEGVTNIINEANALGQVDGIFNLAMVLRDSIFENQTEEHFHTTFAPKAVATKLLDNVSRKLCPKLNYFVVFSSIACGKGNAAQTNYGMANSVAERICEQRMEDGLPGLAIQWGTMDEVGYVADKQVDNQEVIAKGHRGQSISSFLQCLDAFLKQKKIPILCSMMLAEKKADASKKGNIVDTVANIIGIRDLKSISLHTSLSELGMDSMMAVDIKQTLELDFEVFLTITDIRGLTFAKLAEFGAKSKEVSPSQVENLESTEQSTLEILNLHLRLMGDELLASKSLVTLKSLAAVGKSPVFLIPGTDGLSDVFENLAKKLEYPTLCVQFPYNNIANESMQATAEYMLPIIKSYLPLETPFTIVGYSSGAIVSIELAFLLEAEGRTGNLYLLDGAPDFVVKNCRTAFGKDEMELENMILRHTINLIVPGQNQRDREELARYKTWDEKVDHMVKITPTTVHSKQHQITTVNDWKKRLLSLLRYERNFGTKLRAKVTLIRPTEHLIQNGFPEDYNLSKICDNSVDVHFVDGNHLTMLNNEKAALIINGKYVNGLDIDLGNFGKKGTRSQHDHCTCSKK